MSYQAVSWCMNPPRAYGADYLVLLAVAERADKDGRNSYGSVEDIARRANLCHFGDLAEPTKRVRENAMRSARRSLAKLETEGLLEDCGAHRTGVRNRRVCMEPSPDTVSDPDKVSSGSVPGMVSDPDDMSGDPDDVSAEGDYRSGRGDDMSVFPDDMSPEPSEEPILEPSEEQCAEPAPPLVPPHAGGNTYPSGDEDAERVAAQQAYNNEQQSAGLSPFSAAVTPAPASHLAAERIADEEELAEIEDLLAQRPDDKMLGGRREELEHRLNGVLTEVAA